MPASEALTSLYVDVAPEGCDLAGVLEGVKEDLKSCDIFDPASYDKIAEVFDIDTSGLHFKLAKSCNDPKEAVYNLLIARHLVKPSPAGTCKIKDLVWLPIEGMHRWLSLLSLICGSDYSETGIVELNSLSDVSLRTGLGIKDSAERIDILQVLKNEGASLRSLFELVLNVHVYSAQRVPDSSHLSAQTVLTHFKKQSEVISTDKIRSSSKPPILTMVEGLSLLSGMKFEGEVQSSAEYSSMCKHFEAGIFNSSIYKNYTRNPSLGKQTKIIE